MMKNSNNISLNQHTMQGSTLVEVMVSVFLLAFGVLGLMAAQIRSVAAISEAENRSIVAQAAENLADGMQINPEVVQIGSKAVVRRYPDYLTTQSITPNPTMTLPNPSWGSSWSATSSVSDISKAALAKQQLNLFNYSLNQIPNASNVQYVICLDNSNPAEPTMNGTTISGNCRPSNTSNDKTVIQVMWTIPSENQKSTPPVYSYRMDVPQ